MGLGAAQVGLEEEQAGGVGGEDEGEVVGRGGVRKDARGDGEDRDARRRRERDGGVSAVRRRGDTWDAA